MAEQNNWTYCVLTTKAHCISKCHPDCIEKIDTVCKNDGAKHTPFENEICLNLDKVEINQAKFEKRDRRKTMDFSLGLKHSDYNQNRFLLVELRLRYKNVNNLSQNELKLKIDNSRNILGNNPVIINHYYFVFPSQLKHQAHRNLRRLFSNKSFVSGVDLDDIKRIYF